MTRAELVAEIRRLLKDTNTNPSVRRWDDVDIISRADIVQNEMSAMTDIFESRLTAGLDVGIAEYDLPSTFIHEKAVMALGDDDSNNWITLEKKSEKELDNINLYWRNDTGFPPSNYYIRRDKKIGIYPIPSKTKASSLRVDFYRYPDSLASGDDNTNPFNGEYKLVPFHEFIAFGVARLCKMDEQDWQNSDKFEQKYATGLIELKRLVSQNNEEVRIPNLYESTRHSPRRTR